MIYLWPQSGDVSDLSAGFGIMTRPSDKSIPQGIKEGRPFAVDNEAFTQGFDPDTFFPYLEKLAPYQEQCLFAVVPDVVSDAPATLRRFKQWSKRIREMGFPIAFVAQDGQESLDLPREEEFTDYCYENLDGIDDLVFYETWSAWERETLSFDALFVGGTTDWKMGQDATLCIQRARRLGLPVHIGRVNSQTRFRHFQLLGADSCDGTTACHAPDQAKRRLSAVVAQSPLFYLKST